jgi:Zinc dependent phospholipase C
MRNLRGLALLACVTALPVSSRSYSVLTHEQVIDLAWKEQIRPMLLERFPQATPDDLKHAHAFAYGGSVMPDMGYYPFGRKYFSNLVHYVRSGDFVAALIEESTDIREYAFALGALAHYSSDNLGHPTINQVVAMEFPNLRKKFGNEVTYADNHKAHISTEFGFDMVQVAKNRYTSDQFHDLIGFEISKPLLERAFLRTYGLPLKQVLGDEDLAIGSFRRAVSTVIPEMTRVALLNRRAELVRDTPNFDEQKFLYHLSRSQYEKQWGKGYRRPGFGAHVLALLLRVIPKVGPASALDFKVPDTQTEDMYIRSVNRTMDDYGARLRQARDRNLKFADTDCDTGRDSQRGEYPLADETYSRLLRDLDKVHFAQMSPALRTAILWFYSNPKAPLSGKPNDTEWRRTEQALRRLKNSQGSGTPAPVEGAPVEFLEFGVSESGRQVPVN